LLHDDWRRIRQIVPEERRKTLSKLGAVDARERLGRQDELEKGITPHPARADSGTQSHHEQLECHAGAIAPDMKRTEQHQSEDASRRAQRDLFGDTSAQRVPDQVKPVKAFLIHDRERVLGKELTE
jgi:hypothetical protein